MPTYEYECLECKHRFEVVHSMTENPVKGCVKCGKDVRKVFSSAGIIFKGSGFYVNDYRKDASRVEKKGSEAPAGPSGCDSGSCPAGSSTE
jgi:putative FmdB family regulatory protein